MDQKDEVIIINEKEFALGKFKVNGMIHDSIVLDEYELSSQKELENNTININSIKIND